MSSQEREGIMEGAQQYQSKMMMKKRKFINKQKAYKNITAMSNYAREIMNVWQLFRSEG